MQIPTEHFNALAQSMKFLRETGEELDSFYLLVPAMSPLHELAKVLSVKAQSPDMWLLGFPVEIDCDQDAAYGYKLVRKTDAITSGQ